MSAGRVVVVGDLVNDVVAVPREAIRPDTDTPARIKRTFGGSAANTATWLASHGVAVDFVAAVGAHDAATHEDELRAVGVTPHLQVEFGVQTGTIIIIVDGQQRTMLTERGANALLEPASVTRELLDGARMLHVSGYSVVGGFGVEGTRDVMRRAAGAGVPVSVNPGSIGFITDFGVERFLEAIQGASLLFLSADEAELLTGEANPDAAVRLLGASFPLVALTRGADGVLVVADGGEPLAMAAHDVRSVDPTGAGDAFIAGFLDAWLRTGNPVEAAQSAVYTAARAVMVMGGRPPL